MYEIFERLCKEKNVTPYKVSKATGISRSTLSDWKNGKSEPKTGKLQLIADYFEVPLETFTGKKRRIVPVFRKRNGEEVKFDSERLYSSIINAIAEDERMAFEKLLASRYYSADEGTQAAVRKLLDIADEKRKDSVS